MVGRDSWGRVPDPSAHAIGYQLAQQPAGLPVEILATSASPDADEFAEKPRIRLP
jgi:hypothetical protein